MLHKMPEGGDIKDNLNDLDAVDKLQSMSVEINGDMQLLYYIVFQVVLILFDVQ